METSVVPDIANVVEKWKDKKGNLIMILHEIQNQYGYVPREISFQLSKLLDVPLARIYEVLTFYNYFKLKPPGKYTVSVCMGTACYLKGAPELLEELHHILGIKEGETTKDGMFQLEIVRCLGCCGLAPVVKIGNKIYGGLKRSDIVNLLSQYSKEGAPVAQPV
ncbi:MAG: NAD(P)H-dependent oxidoreductase subunit E [Candidatus Omnitrophica bacterium]|nr:NAD(P)H-dependent oxidoreductase subunit E [Candidatus Omnitrophota bacterium]MDD5672235.1 NAD(P)H-dependent oxidoreductase subunit E [Candidatus Omnitrophota bacterium]